MVGDELLEAHALRNVDSGLREDGRLQRVVGREADKITAFLRAGAGLPSPSCLWWLRDHVALLRDRYNFSVHTDISVSLSDRQASVALPRSGEDVARCSPHRRGVKRFCESDLGVSLIT